MQLRSVCNPCNFVITQPALTSHSICPNQERLHAFMYNVYIVRYSAICVGSEGVFMLGCFILFIAIMTSESVEVCSTVENGSILKIH